MNLNQLAVFLAVAQEKSVSRGAEKLHISQPAVSKQVRELEKTLNVALFHRLSSGVQLTQAGETLLVFARQIFALERDAENAMRELRGLERGSLTIGASSTIGVYLLPAVCAAFSRKFPGIELKLNVDNSDSIKNQVLENRVDVAFVEGVMQEDSALHSQVFRHDEIVVIAATNHALAGKTIRAEQLRGEAILAREAGSGTRAVVEEALRSKGLAFALAMALGNTEAIKRAVEDGIGIAWVSRLAVEREVASGRLAILKIEDLEIMRPLHRLKKRGKYETRAAREFWKMLKTEPQRRGGAEI